MEPMADDRMVLYGKITLNKSRMDIKSAVICPRKIDSNRSNFVKR